jgi:hypothetical protein
VSGERPGCSIDSQGEASDRDTTEDGSSVGTLKLHQSDLKTIVSQKWADFRDNLSDFRDNGIRTSLGFFSSQVLKEHCAFAVTKAFIFIDWPNKTPNS